MAEFAARMGVVVEEADETVFWLELLVETGIVPRQRMRDILTEAGELLRIFAATRRSARFNAAVKASSPNHQITKSPNR
jgi:four helix bundle protein